MSQSSNAVPFAKGECFYAENVDDDGGFIQKVCELWISSTDGLNSATATAMLRAFLAGLATGETALPFGVDVVAGVSIGNTVTIPLSVQFATAACDANKLKVSTASTACECSFGFESDGKGGCAACDENEFKAAVSDSKKCIGCPDGSESEPGSRVCTCHVEGYVLDETEMLCRDAHGNVFREAFKILGFDGLVFILVVSGAFLVLLFTVVYCCNGSAAQEPKAAPVPGFSRNPFMALSNSYPPVSPFPNANVRANGATGTLYRRF